MGKDTGKGVAHPGTPKTNDAPATSANNEINGQEHAGDIFFDSIVTLDGAEYCLVSSTEREAQQDAATVSLEAPQNKKNMSPGGSSSPASPAVKGNPRPFRVAVEEVENDTYRFLPQPTPRTGPTPTMYSNWRAQHRSRDIAEALKGRQEPEAHHQKPEEGPEARHAHNQQPQEGAEARPAHQQQQQRQDAHQQQQAEEGPVTLSDLRRENFLLRQAIDELRENNEQKFQKLRKKLRLVAKVLMDSI